MLKRFFALREEIALFKAMKDNDVPALADPTVIIHLAFLTDITHKCTKLEASGCNTGDYTDVCQCQILQM